MLSIPILGFRGSGIFLFSFPRRTRPNILRFRGRIPYRIRYKELRPSLCSLSAFDRFLGRSCRKRCLVGHRSEKLSIATKVLLEAHTGLTAGSAGAAITEAADTATKKIAVRDSISLSYKILPRSERKRMHIPGDPKRRCLL